MLDTPDVSDDRIVLYHVVSCCIVLWRVDQGLRVGQSDPAPRSGAFISLYFSVFLCGC